MIFVWWSLTDSFTNSNVTNGFWLGGSTIALKELTHIFFNPFVFFIPEPSGIPLHLSVTSNTSDVSPHSSPTQLSCVS